MIGLRLFASRCHIFSSVPVHCLYVILLIFPCFSAPPLLRARTHKSDGQPDSKPLDDAKALANDLKKEPVSREGGGDSPLDNIPAPNVKVRSRKTTTAKEDADLIPPAKLKPVPGADQQIEKPAVPVARQPGLVKPPDHLDGVPLERDGHLNKHYRREVLLGINENNIPLEEFGHFDPNVGPNSKQIKETDAVNHLASVFNKADKNKDSKLNVSELEEWILDNTLKHLDEAVDENNVAFKAVDQDGNGFVSWDDYHYHFLVDNKLMDPEKAKHHKDGKGAHSDLSDDDQDKIETELQQWHEADNDPKDGQLSEREFLAFRHPEHSKVMLDSMVREILSNLDGNGDGRLSLKEFAAPAKGVVDKEWQQREAQFLNERKQEFKDSIDINGDGFADFEELLSYTNPRNSLHARKEAEELLELADTNGDQLLSLDEAMAHKDLLLGSGLVNVARNMHNEL